MTEFSALLFTTTPSGKAVTYAISSVSGSVTAPSGLNAVDVSDTINIKITPTDTSTSGWMMYQFYIRATITETGLVHESSYLTLYYGCGSWTTLSDDGSFTTSKTVTEADSVSYEIQGISTAQPTSCPITNYEISSTTGSYTALSELTQPGSCTNPCTSWTIDTSTVQTIQFYVKVTLQSGDILYVSSQVTIDVLSICHNAVFSPSIASQIGMAIQYSKTEFSEPLFITTNPPGCPVAYVISTSNSGIVTPSGLNALVDVSDTINFKVTPSDATVSGYAQHNFNLRATITTSNHANKQEWTNQLTFFHGCGSWSTLDESSLVPLSFTHVQYDAVNYIIPALVVKTDSGGTQEYTCTITDYEFTTNSGSVVAPSGLSKEAGCSPLPCTKYVVDTSSATTIQFYTKVTFEGGSSKYTTNLVAITVLDFCHAATFDSNSIGTPTQYSKIEFSSALYTTIPKLCQIDYVISSVNTLVSSPIDLDPTVEVSDLTNFKIKPSSTSYMMHQFYLKGTIRMSLIPKNYHWSQLLTLYHGCGTWNQLSEDSTFLTTAVFTKSKLSYYNISGLSIQNPSSCQVLSHEISTTSGTFTAQSILSQDSSSDLIWKINTSTIQIFKFYVQVTIEGGSQYYSSQVSLNITCEICGRQKVLLKNEAAKFDIKVGQFGGEKIGIGAAGTFVSIPMVEIHDLFNVTCPACQSLYYSTVQKSPNETYSMYKKEDIFIEVLGQYLRIRTNEPITLKTIYIQAYEKFSKQSFYVPVNVEVTGQERVINSINEPPYFFTAPKGFMIDIETQDDHIYELPDIIDQMNHTIFIEVKGLPEFMIFDEEKRQIVMNSLRKQAEGFYVITFNLSDSLEASQSYDLNIILKRVSANNETLEFLQLLQNNETQLDITNTTAEIESISFLGVLVIKFNSEMKTKFINITDINSTVVDIKINPSKSRTSDNDSVKLNLTWDTVSYEKEYLTIQLSFQYPYEISMTEIYDELQVNLKQRDFFISEEYLTELSDDYRILRQKIQPQMKLNLASKQVLKSADTFTTGSKILLVLNFLVGFLLMGSNSYMINFIRSLQMIIHLPMLMIIIPANVSAFFSKMIPIVTFDILDSDWTTQLVFKFDELMHIRLEPTIFDQMETLGYETHNALMNLGSLAIFSFIYYVRLFILLVFLRKISRLKDYKDKLFKMLIFREILQISTEGYFEFLISGIMNVTYPLTSTSGEMISTCYGYYSLAVATVFTPAILLYVFTRNMEIIKGKIFQERWGSLFDGFRLNSRFQSFYIGVFFIRRAIFVAVAFLLAIYPWLQIQLVIFMNLMIFIFTGSAKSHDSILKNRLENFNELCIHSATICMLLFTDLMPKQSDHYTIGWGMIGLIYFCFLMNLLVIIFFSLKNFWLIFVKYYRIFMRWQSKIKWKAKKQQIQPSAEPVIQNEEQKEVDRGIHTISDNVISVQEVVKEKMQVKTTQKVPKKKKTKKKLKKGEPKELEATPRIFPKPKESILQYQEATWLHQAFMRSRNSKDGCVKREDVMDLYRDIGENVDPDIVDEIFNIACTQIVEYYYNPSGKISIQDFIKIAMSHSEHEINLEIAKKQYIQDQKSSVGQYYSLQMPNKSYQVPNYLEEIKESELENALSKWHHN